MAEIYNSSCGPASNTMSLTLTAEIAEFDRLRIRLQEFTRGLPEEIAKHLLIAADEIFTNIVSYAYSGTTGPVEVSAEQDGKIFRLTFADAGKPFDPLQTADPDIKSRPEERPIGGLGIFVVKKLMDKVEYRRENNRNILTLTKRISTGVPPC